MSLIVISNVIISLVLSITASPVVVNVLEQMKMDEDIKSKVLLDETKFPFLKECSNSQNELVLCNVYYDVLLAINCTQNDTYLGISQVNNTDFCQSLATTVPKNSSSTKTGKYVVKFSAMIQNRRTCDIACMDLDSEGSTSAKDICKAILWGYTQIKSPIKVIKQEDLIVNPDPKSKKGPAVDQPIITEAGLLTPKDNNPVEKIAAQQLLPDIIPQQQEKPKKETKAPVLLTNSTKKEEETHSTDNNKTNTKKETTDENIASRITPKAPEIPKEHVAEVNLNTLVITDTPINNITPASDASNIDLPADLEKENQSNFDEEADQGDYEEDTKTSFDSKQPVEQPKADPEIDRVDTEKYGFAEEDSNFFTFFLFGSIFCILCYVLYHNKTKVLALVLEGRRSSNSRGGNSRRKHTAAYRKLDSNLEEAITSSSNSSGLATAQQIIY